MPATTTGHPTSKPMTQPTSDPKLEAETYFAIVPEWVAFCGVPRAVQVYAVLARFANSEGVAWPGRNTIAQLANCSADTVDRTLDVLQEMGAVTVERRPLEDGSWQTNRYTLHFSAPPAGWKSRVAEDGSEQIDGVVAPARRGSRTSAETPSRTSAELTRPIENESQEPLAPATAQASDYWDALEQVFGYRPVNSSSERSLWGSIVKLVQETGDPPDEIIRRASLWVVGEVWAGHQRQPKLTPGALKKHYQWLGSRLASATDSELEKWRQEWKRRARRVELEQEGSVNAGSSA